MTEFDVHVTQEDISPIRVKCDRWRLVHLRASGGDIVGYSFEQDNGDSEDGVDRAAELWLPVGQLVAIVRVPSGRVVNGAGETLAELDA